MKDIDLTKCANCRFRAKVDEKKVVEDIPKPYEFKKGEPVLLRDNGFVWKIGVFTKMRSDYFQYGAMTNGLDECGYHFCLPYNERTMHLLGTAEDYKEEQEMREKYDIIIGIDPDVNRNGVAVLDTFHASMELFSYSFAELMEFLPIRKERADAEGDRLLVVVEASWMTEANWHGRSGDNRRQASSKGYDVGRNHETGKKIVEMAKDHYGLQVRCKHPLRKCWSGKDGKITHWELMSLLEGSGVVCTRKVTNQEERDAALLALDASGIAMRMKGGVR